jgi:hypothetical protein
MSVRKVKAARSTRRWLGWDQHPLEARQLMSVAPVAEVAGRVDLPAASLETHVLIHNSTDIPVKIAISDIDNYDWDGNSRPDYNLNGVVLKPGESIEKREEINKAARPHFTISLEDPTTGTNLVTARAGFVQGWLLDSRSQRFDYAGKSLTLVGGGPELLGSPFVLKKT